MYVIAFLLFLTFEYSRRSIRDIGSLWEQDPRRWMAHNPICRWQRSTNKFQIDTKRVRGIWSKEDGKRLKGASDVLLKLRADVNRVSPKVDRVQKELPSLCSYYGKDSSPQTLAFLNSLSRYLSLFCNCRLSRVDGLVLAVFFGIKNE